jgi:ABC-type glutathione transport system ATPase component
MEKIINNKKKKKEEKKAFFKKQLLEKADGFFSGFKHRAKGNVVVDIRDVYKDFILGNNNKVNILKGINVQIKRGEFVLLM